MTVAADLITPALVVDAEALEFNLNAMSLALPGDRLRPHVKAHKCTALARRQAEEGHHGFCCATLREIEGMAAAGLGADLLLANETLDGERLRALAAGDARVSIAVDSEATVAVAADAGVREVMIDVNVGMPRCGCAPEDAGRLADDARAKGMDVRGVMGYEGHVVGLPDRTQRTDLCNAAMELLLRAHDDVGGEVVSAGGTGTFDINMAATEIQAGSYALMDTAYGELDIPFRQAVFVVATVISVSEGFAVADCGLKALAMDHGNPSIPDANVWFCSDEHITFAAPPADAGTAALPTVGDRIAVIPAHVDPTLAKHERMHILDTSGTGGESTRDRIVGAPILDTWEIDLRHW